MQRRTPAIRLFGLIACWFAVVMLAGIEAAVAQRPVEKEVGPPSDLDVDAVLARLKKTEGSKNLDESTRRGLTDAYQKTLEQLKSRDQFAAKGAAFIAGIKQVPVQVQHVRNELNAPADALAIVHTDLPLVDLRQSLTQAETRQAEMQATLKELSTESIRRADRRVEIPKLQEAARKQLADVEQRRAVKPSADENAEITQANRMLLDARKQAADLEFEAYDQELRFYEASGDLLTSRRDLAVIQATQADHAVNALRTAVHDRRRNDAEDQARAASLAALQSHPAIKRLARDTKMLGERKTIAKRLKSAPVRGHDRPDRRKTDLG